MSEIQKLEIAMLKAKIAYLERLVADQGLVVEGNVGEMLARRIEADDFHLSPDFTDAQINVALACRMRYANMMRGKK